MSGSGLLDTNSSYVNSTLWSAGNAVRPFRNLVLDKVRPRLGDSRSEVTLRIDVKAGIGTIDLELSE